MTKFLIIGDLHGNKPIISTKDFDAIIAPGDFCSDALRKYMFEALKREIQTGQEYWWYEMMSKNKAKKEVRKSLKDGRKILQFLNSFNKPIFVLPGNWDWTGRGEDWQFLKKNYWKSYLIKNLSNIKDCHKRIYNFEGINIIGHGITSGPEYPTKETIKRHSKKELVEKKKKYKKLFSQMSKKFSKAKEPVIFLSHNVPYNTSIDKIINKDSPMNGKHMGSYLARELTLKHSPLVCIGGHMHEHFGKTKLGKTVCINAGFGSYVNTILEIQDNKIKRLKFIKK